ncbi:MAG: alpha/beta hydrolase [Gammaproteobacteria bacterium]|nr:alpha/beta hydrolase [Gammaproteobacteria bacterium]MCW5583596.1 alpha/beta hydrolase [Gammaproteobacteria bacterium]
MNKSFPICYETFGNMHNPCIILIVGIGGQLIDWPSILTCGLADKGFYVVVFDNRDSGLSKHYDEVGVPNFSEAIAAKQQGQPFNPSYTLEDMATDVITLMDELHIKKAHIVGSSMGGIIAQYVAINNCDRALSLTCIYSTSGDPTLPPSKKEVLGFFATSMNTENLSLEAAVNKKLKLFKIYNHPDFFDEGKIVQQLTAAFKRANNPNGFKRILLAMICAQSRTEQLKKLSIPCLIIHGDYDPVFPLEHGKQLADSIPGSHLEVIKKMGHGLPDEFAKKVVDLIARHFK